MDPAMMAPDTAVHTRFCSDDKALHAFNILSLFLQLQLIEVFFLNWTASQVGKEEANKVDALNIYVGIELLSNLVACMDKRKK